MKDCNAKKVKFGKLGCRRLEAEFSGGAVSSDGRLAQQAGWISNTGYRVSYCP